jgi:hypothetical protein
MLRTTLLLFALALPTAPLVGVAVAHDCNGQNPAFQCGDCLVGRHDHRHFDGRTYCRSNPTPVACVEIPVLPTVDDPPGSVTYCVP